MVDIYAPLLTLISIYTLFVIDIYISISLIYRMHLRYEFVYLHEASFHHATKLSSLPDCDFIIPLSRHKIKVHADILLDVAVSQFVFDAPVSQNCRQHYADSRDDALAFESILYDIPEPFSLIVSLLFYFNMTCEGYLLAASHNYMHLLPGVTAQDTEIHFDRNISRLWHGLMERAASESSITGRRR
jgi:hypothetical protein